MIEQRKDGPLGTSIEGVVTQFSGQRWLLSRVIAPSHDLGRIASLDQDLLKRIPSRLQVASDLNVRGIERATHLVE